MGFADLMAAAWQTGGPALGTPGSITYTPGVGVAVVVDGIFTAPHTQVDGGEQGGGVSTVAPTVFLTLDDLPSDPKTDSAAARVTVGGVTYRWHDVQPDGMGGALLLLHRVV